MNVDILYDRIAETTTTTGTSDLALGGAVTDGAGFNTFASRLSDGQTCYYYLEDETNGDWETGIGTFVAAGPTLQRTTVHDSSAGAATKVTLSAGSKTVACTMSANAVTDLDNPDKNSPGILTSSNDTMEVNKTYVPTGGSVIELTLPASAALGDVIRIVGLGAGLFEVHSNASAAGQKVTVHDSGGDNESNTSSSSAEKLAESANSYDSLVLVCTAVSGPTHWESIEHSDATVTVTLNSDRGLFGGGNTSQNTIDFVNISSAGNATDFGDLTYGRFLMAGCSSSTRGLFAGANSGSYKDIIDFVIIASAGNATDFGDLTAGRYGPAACSSATRGLWAGADQGSYGDVIDFVTIASAGNATDFGDLTASRAKLAGCSSATRGVFGGGGGSNVIDFVTIASAGNATDFGDLTISKMGRLAACSSATRGLFGGGYNNVSYAKLNEINFVTIASAGNATDFGDLTAQRRYVAGCSNSTVGLFGGGEESGYVNNIDQVNISSAGNATDFGDLTAARWGMGACSGNHGGLQ